MNPWHDVYINSDNQNQLNCILEIPLGCKVKYELDKNFGPQLPFSSATFSSS